MIPPFHCELNNHSITDCQTLPVTIMVLRTENSKEFLLIRVPLRGGRLPLIMSMIGFLRDIPAMRSVSTDAPVGWPRFAEPGGAIVFRPSVNRKMGLAT